MTRKTQLSKERILSAARTVVEDEGLVSLSMRRLAQELDVWPMSVYRYFQDKDDLVDALAASSAEAFEAPPRRGSWQSQMRRLLETARARLAADPAGLGGRLPRAVFQARPPRPSGAALSVLP